MINRTQEELRSKMLEKGYKFFDTSVNLIGERLDDTFDNEFSDTLHVAYHDQTDGQKKVLDLPWTTLAGTLAKGGVLNPVTTGGINVATGQQEVVKGVAVLKEGQYSKTYQFMDSYVAWLSYPWFQQIAPVDVYRDGILNYTIDRNSPIHRGIFGINLHRMTNNGQVSKQVNYAESVYAPNGVAQSMGCNGAPEPEFKKLLPIVRADVKKFGSIFTYTLLHTKDF